MNANHQFRLQQNAQRHRMDIVYIALVVLLIWGYAMNEDVPSHRSSHSKPINQRITDKKSTEESPFGSLGVENSQAAIKLPPELSLITKKRTRKVEEDESSHLRQQQQQVEDNDEGFDDYTEDDDVYEEDEELGALARIERAIVAPVHLIGSVPNLQPGSVLRPADDKEQVSFPRESMVLITEMTDEFYRGYIINSPLPEEEIAAARKALRIAESEVKINPDRIRFFGYGGPVRTSDERWGIIHNNPSIEGANVIGDSLAVGGDLEAIFQSQTTLMMVLYGGAVWIPGQLEREIKEGLWKIDDQRMTKFTDVLQLCLSS